VKITMTSLPDIHKWKEAIDAEDEESALTEIRNCYCPSCHQSNAVSLMLPTKVPMFREILVMSLNCEDCNFRNSEVSFGGEIQERGETIYLDLKNKKDLDRQIIKSDSCTLTIPSLQFEIPANTQRGMVSTIEGMLLTAVDNLEAGQQDRLRLGDIDNFHRCREVIDQLKRMIGHSVCEEEDISRVFQEFTLILDDPAGNSFIENPHAPKEDTQITKKKYFRTAKQDMSLGLQPSKAAMDAGTIDDNNPSHKNVLNSAAGSHSIDTKEGEDEALGAVGIGRREVMKFQTPCPHCHLQAETSMCVTDIPHFKEVVLMALYCEQCGFKSNEIKGGGGIPKYGTRITLRVRSHDDLAREVLKSDSAGIEIPEIEMELEEGGLDGMYTTVEGLLQKIHKRLEEANPFGHGDSTTKQHLTNDPAVEPGFAPVKPDHAKFVEFLQKLLDMKEGQAFPFTIIISDPLSNSFVGPVPEDAVRLALQADMEGKTQCFNDYVDSGMIIEEYQRTLDQDEQLGLLDMKTENYQDQGPDNHEDHGTDQMLDLPDRLSKPEFRGVDHPHEVGKAPVEGDVTIMGPKSTHFAVPGMLQRGTAHDEHK